MPLASFDVPHNLLNPEIVKKRIHDAIVKAAFEGEFERIEDLWPQERMGRIELTLNGVEYTANLTVANYVVHVEIPLTWMTWIFRTQVEKEIRTRLERSFSIALAGL